MRNLGGTLGLAISGATMLVFQLSFSRYGADVSFSNNIFVSALRRENLDRALLDSIMENPFLLSSKVSDPLQLDRIVDGYRRGFKSVFITLASLATFAWFIAFFLLRHQTLKRSDDDELKRQAIQRLEEGKK